MNRIEVFVNQHNTAKASNVDDNLRKLLGEANVDWIFVKDNYTSVNLDAYPALTKMQKFELLLAHYSTEQII